MKKGFTLIELLAVIVILAIIALITIPVILKMIENAKINSYKRSIDLYGKAISSAIVAYESDQVDNKQPFNLTLDNIERYIDYTGNDVDCNIKEIYKDKTIFLSGCNVNGIPVRDSNGYDGWYFYTNIRESIMAKKYVEAIEITLENSIITDSCIIQSNGELSCNNGNTYKINSKMDLPNSGEVEIADGKVISYKNLSFDSILVSNNNHEEKVEYSQDTSEENFEQVPTNNNNANDENTNNNTNNTNNTTNNANTNDNTANNNNSNDENTNNTNTNDSTINNNSNDNNQNTLTKDYVIIDYLESTGTQFINLGIYAKDLMHFQIKVNPKKLNDWSALFSTATGYNGIPQFCVDISNSNNYVYWNYGNQQKHIWSYSASINNDYVVDVYLDKSTKNEMYYNGKLVDSTNWSGNLPTTDLFLLAKNYGDNKTGHEFFIGKLYYFKVYKNNVLYMDMIPVYRKSDRVVGMYDRVNNKFYTNMGSGTFKMNTD